MMVKMIPMRFATILLASAFLLAGCDREGITVVAEVSETFDFEGGLSGWTGGSQVSPGGVAALVPSTENASGGTGSARLLLDDPAGTGTAWMIREFTDLAEDRSYDVELEFDLGSPDTGAAPPWTLVAAAGGSEEAVTQSPGGVGDTQVLGEGDVAFETRTLSLIGTSDAEGRLFVLLGVRQETAGSRAFFVDDLTVRLTRR